MAVTARTLKLQQQLRAQLAKVTDAQTRALVAAWVDAWQEVEPDLTAALLEQLVAGERVTKAQLLRSTRLRKALAVIADQLQALAKQTGTLVIADLRGVIDTAGAAQASVIDSQLPPGASQLVDLEAWSAVNPRQVEAIVKRTTQQITSTLKPLSTEAYDAVRRELIRGIASGANPRATAARMVKRAEGGFNGGLNRALTIARTETLSAHREAAQLSQAEHTDVLKGWVWLTELSKRTCPACLSMSGTEHKLTEPGPLGHQNCRCARGPLTKSWADLGFPDIDEPASLLPDAAGFFTSLPEADQIAMLGKTGHAAWARGDWPIEKWSTRKSTNGWRDSYVVSKPPKTARRAAA